MEIYVVSDMNVPRGILIRKYSIWVSESNIYDGDTKWKFMWCLTCASHTGSGYKNIVFGYPDPRSSHAGSRSDNVCGI
jgi:hypothetical protein